MVSIIIPTINRYGDLENTIEDIQSQSFKDWEIIIIDQTPTEENKSLSLLDERITYIHRTDFSSASAARNVGILASKGEIVLFIDDDVEIDSDKFLENHLRHYEDPSIHGVVGGVLSSTRKIRTNRHKWSYSDENGWLFFPLNYDKPARLKSGASCNMSVRKSSALKVGGMNERYEKGAHREESDFTYRLCNKYGLMVFDPQAALIHLQTPSGGIRNWNKESLIKAQHHFDGAIYFILQSVPLKYQWLHWLVTIRYFFYRREILSSPKLFSLTLLRIFKGIRNAIDMKIKRPKYISS